MVTLAAIRTHRWDEDAMRLAAQLAPVFGDRLVVVFHNRPAGLVLPHPVVDIDDAWVRANGLRVLPDWGWRCGDYALYALRQAYPQADHMWLIEPDVAFTGPVADFFAAMAARDDDLLAVRIEPSETGHRFARGLPGLALWRAIFALLRVSGRAVDHLFALRRAYAAGPVGARFFTNDERFVVSHLMADPAFTTAAMADLAPDWLGRDTLRTDPDLLVDVLAGQTGPGIFHPVRGHHGFCRAVAARLAQNTGFLPAMRPSLARLAPQDLNDIAAQAARMLETALIAQARGPGPDETEKD